MTTQMTTQQLREELTAHLDSVTPPPGDLDAVLRRSRQAKVRRTAGPALLAAAAVGVVALALTQTTGPSSPDSPDKAEDDVSVADGPVDVSDGLRAYASPGEKLYMGGAEWPSDAVELDTDAAATPYGIAFYDAGSPWLLRPDGTKVRLDDRASETGDFSPTIKADALQPHVAFALLRDDELELVVYDLEDRSVVASTVVTCPEGCEDRVIDGIDGGAVFLRSKAGTTVWDYDRGERYFFAGPETRVADVRNGVVLFDGVRPPQAIEGWRYVSGAIDAQLSFDGKHVLYWSDELTSTALRGTSTIKLDLPEPATFFTFDTDGSVLAATVNDPVSVFDCDIPSGTCTKIGEMSAEHGDPMFIGNDM